MAASRSHLFTLVGGIGMKPEISRMILESGDRILLRFLSAVFAWRMGVHQLTAGFFGWISSRV